MCKPPLTGVFSQDAIFQAFLKCRRAKRNSSAAIAFEQNLASEVSALHTELETQEYKPRPAQIFAVSQPKPREIVSAHFRDRVVQHLLVTRLEADWERVFIHDSYACRKNKGTHAAVERLSAFVRSALNKHGPRTHYLQLDISSFFLSINRHILFGLLNARLRKRFGLPRLAQSPVSEAGQLGFIFSPEPGLVSEPAQYKQLRWLIQTLLFQDFSRAQRLGDLRLLDQVPRHKKIVQAGKHCGLPLGALTSQFFANVYLNRLDQFVKHQLKAKHYLRYVDDFVLLAKGASELRSHKRAIENFLATQLRLKLNPARTRLRSISSGIDFLGYVQHPTHRLVRKRVVGNLKAKLSQTKRLLVQRSVEGQEFVYNKPVILAVQASLASYFAHFNHANSHHLKTKIVQEHSWLRQYFEFSTALRLRPFVAPPSRRFVAQHHWLKWAAQRASTTSLVLAVEMGERFVFLGKDAELVQKITRAKRHRKWKRSVAFVSQEQLPALRAHVLARGHAFYTAKELEFIPGFVPMRGLARADVPKAISSAQTPTKKEELI